MTSSLKCCIEKVLIFYRELCVIRCYFQYINSCLTSQNYAWCHKTIAYKMQFFAVIPYSTHMIWLLTWNTQSTRGDITYNLARTPITLLVQILCSPLISHTQNTFCQKIKIISVIQEVWMLSKTAKYDSNLTYPSLKGLKRLQLVKLDSTPIHAYCFHVNKNMFSSVEIRCWNV